MKAEAKVRITAASSCGSSAALVAVPTPATLYVVMVVAGAAATGSSNCTRSEAALRTVRPRRTGGAVSMIRKSSK